MDGDRKIPAPSDQPIDGVRKDRALHGRTTGPTRRSTKGQWTPEDDILIKAVQRFKGKNWKKIAECFKDRTDVQCLHRWQKVLNPELIKGPWSKEEDDVIIELVNKYGPKKWSTIAQYLPGRIGKQCRERWHNHLNPDINKGAWTQEEELALIHAHQVYGNKWAELTKFLPGRMPRTKNCGRRKPPTASERQRKQRKRGELSQPEHGESSRAPSPPPSPPPPPPPDMSSSSFSSSSDDEEERDDPQDLTLLRSYRGHVAHQIWIGKERDPLNRCINRQWPSDMTEFLALPPVVQQLLIDSGLSHLIRATYDRVDKRLITAFVERWYSETCTFHLPFGEMTITLDDVHSILHIPVTGRFIQFDTLARVQAVDLVVELLGMEQVDAEREITSGYIRLPYLQQWLKRCIREVRYQEATRTYLLYLVGTTLFVNKSGDKVQVHYLEAMRNLDEVSGYAWGASTLAYLYEQLSEASKAVTSQIAGPMSLLQAWILEHFPDIGQPNRVNQDYEEHMPRLFRWVAHQSVGGSEEVFRKITERMTSDRVYWTPYDPAHRAHRPFNSISLYSGILRNGFTLRPHLPERVLRQFRHVQGIPRDPPVITDAMITDPATVDAPWAAWAQHVVDEATRGPTVTYPGECHPDYLDWVALFSHPHLDPTTRRPPSEVERRDVLWRQRMLIVGQLAEQLQQTDIVDRDVVADIITVSRTHVEDPLHLRSRARRH